MEIELFNDSGNRVIYRFSKAEMGVLKLDFIRSIIFKIANKIESSEIENHEARNTVRKITIDILNEFVSYNVEFKIQKQSGGYIEILNLEPLNE